MPTDSRPASAPIRIGCGAGFAGDRLEPAIELANRGKLDYLFFEGLAERTLAQSHLARRADPDAGFNASLPRRIEGVLTGCRDNGTQILTNMGAANPVAAARAIADLARRTGHRGLKIAVITGDDVTDILPADQILIEDGQRLDAMNVPLIRANAYLGAEPIATALDSGAEIVITGRCADPSLVLGPLLHSFRWKMDDWQRLGAGTLVGHLLECSAQITGGYFADPGRKEVAGLDRLGYPLAEVAADGTAVITKLTGTGGIVSRDTVLEQLLYEVHDPAAYLTPDVTADFSAVRIAGAGANRVAVSGASGRARPDTLKVTLGFEGGLLAEAGISYAGRGATGRARLAAGILRERMVRLHGCDVPLRIDLIGVQSLHATALTDTSDDFPCHDLRLRAALRTARPELAAALLREVEALWIAGPAGGGGVRGRVTPSVMTRSALIARDRISPAIEVITA